ncbi:hypothetical protein [Burkholderia pseudomallei]|uniref:hypothetical protein n=1 Tax=Burkholderia pseudomallei TaxID=28450 RepID=UPI000ABABE28|nr:hypothetical protein [Burkholderia pseudomallei]
MECSLNREVKIFIREIPASFARIVSFINHGGGQWPSIGAPGQNERRAKTGARMWSIDDD